MVEEGKEIIEATPERGDLEIGRAPDVVLAEATKAAKALEQVIQQKPRPVVIHGKTYLEFEDWQTVGRFYGITAKVVKAEPVEINGVVGFEAQADAIHVATGRVVSSAVSMCLNDEDKWKGRPLFMLRSMAQTRACGKCLRNVLSWVVVLAGFAATPAEEMDGVASDNAPPKGQAKSNGKKADTKPAPGLISPAQAKRFYAMGKSAEKTDDEMKAHLREHYGIDSTRKIKREDYDALCEWAANPETTGVVTGA